MLNKPGMVESGIVKNKATKSRTIQSCLGFIRVQVATKITKFHKAFRALRDLRGGNAIADSINASI
jgi:hypothetical protein